MDNAKGVYQSSLLQKIQLFYKSKGYGQDTNLSAAGGFDIVESVAKGEL